jgi:protein-S-isoprenylcysteine O-methyltransferase Ste14
VAARSKLIFVTLADEVGRVKANMLTLAVVVLAVVMLALHAHEVEWDRARVVGGVIAGISFPLFVLARIQLGSAFSLQAKAKKLVTTGLYARIRNPIYLFGGLTIAGLSLFLSAWGPLVTVLVIAPLQKFRARNEAQVLADAFGDEYLRYRAKTWF